MIRLKNRSGLIAWRIVFLLFICLICFSAGGSVAHAVPKMKASYEGYEIDGNKLYVKVRIENRTFDLKKRSTAPQKMVLRQLKGNIKVEADGETILKRKQRWRLNECIMPEREVRLYVGELSTDALKKAGKNLKVKLSSLSTKSVVDKRQVHCNVIEWNWDEVKKETRIVVDICNDHYYDVAIDGAEIEAKVEGKEQPELLVWDNMCLVVPKYTHWQVVLYTPFLKGPMKGEFEVKRLHRWFITAQSQSNDEDEEEDEGKTSYSPAAVSENELSYEEYNYAPEEVLIDGESGKSDNSDGDDGFIIVLSRSNDDDYIVIQSKGKDDDFIEKESV